MANKDKIIITGGLGYIGSHTAVQLLAGGYDVVLIDNLSNTTFDVLERIRAVHGSSPTFHQVDLCDKELLSAVLAQHSNAAGIIHFAALKAVGESVKQPLKYYHNNVLGLINLLSVMKQQDISNLVFSSSATVYGVPVALPFVETHRLNPSLSPYATTKKIGESLARDFVHAHTGNKAIVLRYFNPIGAHDSAKLGELPLGVPNNLMPYITQTAAGLREELLVFGDDYPTPDGTAIRDYIHVMDLADAHIHTLRRLINGEEAAPYEIFNIGRGKGSSVLEVIHSFERSTGVKLPYRIVGRREGDIPEMCAGTALASQALGWKAQRDLDDMTRSAWAWEKNYRNL